MTEKPDYPEYLNHAGKKIYDPAGWWKVRYIDGRRGDIRFLEFETKEQAQQFVRDFWFMGGNKVIAITQGNGIFHEGQGLEGL